MDRTSSPAVEESHGPEMSYRSTRREFLKFMGGLGASAFLAACAGPGSQGTPGNGASTSGRTITWYMNSDPVRNAWAEKVIIPGFQKAHPGISVKLMTVPWADHDAKLLTLAAASTSPDVHSLWGQSGGATFVYQDLIQPLDDLIARHGWDLTNIPEKLRKTYVFNGKLYGIPMFSLGSFIFYNRALFDEAKVPYPPLDWDDPGWTWDEMLDRAQRLTKNAGDREKSQYGVNMGMPDLYVGVPWLFGAEPFSQDDWARGRATTINLTSPEYVAAVQAKADLINKHKVAPAPSTIQAISPDGLVLPTGRVAMMYDGGWNFYPLRQIKDLNWGVGAVPRQTTNKVPNFSDPWFISKGSKDPEAAFTFIKYLTTGEGQQSIAADLGAPPADQTLLPSWYKNFSTMAPTDLEKVYQGCMSHAQENAASLLYGYGPLEDVYNQMTPSIMQGEKSAAEVLPEVEKRINDTLKTLK